MKMCLRTLKSRLRSYGLSRRKIPSVSLLNRMESIMQNDLNSPRSMCGYRSSWRNLRLNHGVNVSRDLVMTTLRNLDPIGSAARRYHRLTRRRYVVFGPNYSWHIDGYDKLKPYGFPIHGAIDGYSRKLLWLKVIKSNNDRLLLVAYFLIKLKNSADVLR